MADLGKKQLRKTSQEALQSHKMVWLMIYIGAILIILISIASAETIYEQNNQTSGGAYAVYGVNWKAITFNVTNGSFDISNVSLYMTKQGTPTGLFYVSIRATDSYGNVTGGDLSTGNISTDPWQADAVWRWREKINMTSYILENNTKYALVMSHPTADASNYMWIAYGNTDYTKGNYSGSADSGVSWTLGANDPMFVMWGNTPIAPPGRVTTSLTSPPTGYLTSDINITLNASFTATNSNLSNATYNVWYSNGTLINQTLIIILGNTTNTTSQVFYNFSVGSYIWNVEACGFNETEGFCDLGDNNFTFERRLFDINSQTFNSSTNETSSEGFTINITYDTSFYNSISANLVYNGTSYIGTKTGTGSNVMFSRNLIVPTVATTGTNLSFYWEIILLRSTDTYYYNSSSNNQTVYKGTSLIANYSCPSGYSSAFNFTFYWESNLTTTNQTTINYFLSYGLYGNSSGISINGTLSDTNSFSICINNSQEYYDVGYGEIQYSVTGAEDRRYYIFGGTRLTNTTIDIPLYSLETASATSFLITAETTSIVPYVDHYIGLMRWYPSLNSYKIVDMGKTDDQGQTILKSKTEDVDYKLALYSNSGSLIKLSSSIRLICQTTPCIYTLYVDPEPLDLTTFTNIEKSLTFNSTSGIFTFIWNDPSQASQTMNLTIYQDSGISSEIICSSSSTGYTGVLICDVSGYTGILRAEATRTASPLTIISQLIVNLRQTFIDAGGGIIGLFIGAILLILFALVGVISPVLMIIFAIISLIPLVILGNITIGIFTAIGVIAGVILHFLGRTK